MGDERLPKNDVTMTSSSNHVTSSNYEEPSSEDAASSTVVTHEELPGDDVTHDDVAHDDVTLDDVTHEDVTPTLQLQSSDLQFLETLSYDKSSKTEEEEPTSEGKKVKK